MNIKKEAAIDNDGNQTDSNNILAKSPINLKPSQADVISIFKQYPGKFIHTFIFRDHGKANPSQRINELKNMGALIDTIYKPATDSAGKDHKHVAWYLFKGWEV